MTASPIYQKAGTRNESMQHLLDLQKTLDCTVVTVSARSAVENYISKATEIVLEYEDDSLSISQNSTSPSAICYQYYMQQLRSTMDLSKRSGNRALQSECQKYMDQISDVYNDLGTWCASKLAVKLCRLMYKPEARRRLGIPADQSMKFNGAAAAFNSLLYRLIDLIHT
jgi:hypothetical protein